jgi:choline dehydrogenase-like flavoprotein
MLVTGMRAERILVDRGRAVGVAARASRGGARLTVHARAVVLAGGAVPSPRLLLDQGLCRGSGRLGHGLSLHPATSAAALFEERIARGRESAALGCDEFHREGILLLGAAMLVDIGAVALQMAGRRFADLMDDYDRIASFGVMVETTRRGGSAKSAGASAHLPAGRARGRPPAARRRPQADLSPPGADPCRRSAGVGDRA